MTNRDDLFDDAPETPAPKSEETPDAQPPPTGQEQPPRSSRGASEALEQNLSRRTFLRGAGAAAVAGAVVGAGAAAGFGLGGDDDGAAVAELDGMTLGAPEGRLLSQAVVRLNVNGR